MESRGSGWGQESNQRSPRPALLCRCPEAPRAQAQPREGWSGLLRVGTSTPSHARPAERCPRRTASLWRVEGRCSTDLKPCGHRETTQQPQPCTQHTTIWGANTQILILEKGGMTCHNKCVIRVEERWSGGKKNEDITTC